MVTIFKDDVLDRLAAAGANIAQFVSYGPDGARRMMRIRDLQGDLSVEETIARIHAAQSEPNVNIRTFLPDKPDGNPFFYGPKHGFDDPGKAAGKVRQMCAAGYYVIVNETIDEADGGFSGVLFGDVFEFASRDIPRCVEKPGCAALSRDLSKKLIEAVYGFALEIPYAPDYRVECSVHPAPVGYRGERQVIWQAERMEEAAPVAPRISWPNRYSCDMGDKAFGLLIAHLLGFRVPRTDVFGRVIPLFSFGAATKSGDARWVRTCPSEQQPGKFTTKRGWLDPFALMQREDPDGTRIASLIVQDGIRAHYSGAAVTQADGALRIEGVHGYGDDFMVGTKSPDKLPARVESAVVSLAGELRQALGDVRFEWVYDGRDPWVVQLHVGASESAGSVIYPGDVESFIEFDVSRGLEALRAVIAEAESSGAGIILRGNVGITSHFGDVLRRSKIPSRIQ
jgi:hypothetical protein